MKENDMTTKKILSTLLVAACLSMGAGLKASTPSAAADILNVSPYARGTAMADCMAADDSPFSLYYNPAGIAGTRKIVVGGAWNSLLGNDVMQIAGVVDFPLAKAGVLGVSVLYNSVTGIPVMTYDAGQVAEGTGTFGASDVVLRAGFAKMIGEDFSLGISAKFLYSVIEKSSSPSFCADIGFQIADLLPGLFAGIVIKNLGVGPKFGLKAAELPMIVEAGFQAAVLNGTKKSPHFLALYVQPGYLITEGLARVSLAAEYGFQRSYFLRVGYSFDSKSVYGLTAGIGLKFKVSKTVIPRFDVSFVPDSELGHKVNASFFLNL